MAYFLPTNYLELCYVLSYFIYSRLDLATSLPLHTRYLGIRYTKYTSCATTPPARFKLSSRVALG